VATLRQKLSTQLLEEGVRLDLDRQEIWRKAQQSGARLSSGDLQVLFLLGVVSKILTSLGRLIMPSRLPIS
jgi:hypothetical protein